MASREPLEGRREAGGSAERKSGRRVHGERPRETLKAGALMGKTASERRREQTPSPRPEPPEGQSCPPLTSTWGPCQTLTPWHCGTINLEAGASCLG